jgi:purine nucleoside phosphorylase
MKTVKIGIIGGSGLYKMDALKDVREVSLDTPFGSPSDALILGTLEERSRLFASVMAEITIFTDRITLSS